MNANTVTVEMVKGLIELAKIEHPELVPVVTQGFNVEVNEMGFTRVTIEAPIGALSRPQQVMLCNSLRNELHLISKCGHIQASAMTVKSAGHRVSALVFSLIA